MSYENQNPIQDKLLNSDGSIQSFNNDSISDSTELNVQKFKQSNPIPNKFLYPDGTIKDKDGNIIQESTEENVKRYNQTVPIPAKFLHSDGTVDENIGSGSVTLQEKTATANGVVIPDSGYDGLSKVTVNVSGESSNYTHVYELSISDETALIEHSVEKVQFSEDDFRFLPVDGGSVYYWILSKKELDDSSISAVTEAIDVVKLLQEQDSSVFLTAFDGGGVFFLSFNNGEETLELALLG